MSAEGTIDKLTWDLRKSLLAAGVQTSRVGNDGWPFLVVRPKVAPAAASWRASTFGNNETVCLTFGVVEYDVPKRVQVAFGMNGKYVGQHRQWFSLGCLISQADEVCRWFPLWLADSSQRPSLELTTYNAEPAHNVGGCVATLECFGSDLLYLDRTRATARGSMVAQ